MRPLVTIICLALFCSTLHAETPYFACNLEQNVDGQVNGYKYVFCINEGIVLQIPAPANTAVFGVFRFIPDSNRIQIGWMSCGDGIRFTGKVDQFETIEVTTKGQDVKVQIVDHSNKKQVGSITSSSIEIVPPERRPIVAQVAGTCLTNIKLSRMLNAQQQSNELQLLLEAHKGMRNAGWKYVEKFGQKLGL